MSREFKPTWRVLITALIGLVSLNCGEGRLQEHPFLEHEMRASNGDPEAQQYVAEAYLAGRGASQSFTKAREWFKACADQGIGGCQFHLGRLHEEGLGGPISLQQAGRYYRAAALGGDTPAMVRLGELYWRGDGVPKDLTRACALLLTAALSEDEGAMKTLTAFKGEVDPSIMERGALLAQRWQRTEIQF